MRHFDRYVYHCFRFLQLVIPKQQVAGFILCMVQEFDTPTLFSPSTVQSTTLMTLLTTSKLSTISLKAMKSESCALSIPFKSPGSLPQVSHLLQQNHNQGESPGNNGSLYAEERIPESRCSPLPYVVMDTRCPLSWVLMIQRKCWPGLRTGLLASSQTKTVIQSCMHW